MSSSLNAKPCCPNCKKELLGLDVTIKFCCFCGAQIGSGNPVTDERNSEKATSSLEDVVVKESKQATLASSEPSGSCELNPTQATVLFVNGNDSRMRSASVLHQTTDSAVDRGEEISDWVQVDEHRRRSVRRDERDVRSKSTGFMPSIMPKNHCDVVFHVLVPKYAWTVKRDNFSVFVKFDSQKLGGLKKEHGDFRIVRKTNVFIELESNIQLESDLLYKGIAYLYCIHGSPHDSEEFIYYHPHHLYGHLQRYLKIEKNIKAEKRREYHQYDGMIFPSGEVRVERKFVKDYIKENPKGDRQIFVPSFEIMQYESLEIFLIDFIEDLSELKFGHVIDVTTELIMNVFVCLHCPKFKFLTDDNRPKYLVRQSMGLYKAMSDSLIVIMGNLSAIKDPSLNGVRMVSVVIVMCCYNRLFELSSIKMKDIPENYTANLLSMLRFQPDLENRKCHDWDILSKSISNHKKVKKSIGQFFSYLLGPKFFSKLEWLYAIPLLHFLSKETQPFTSYEHNPHHIPWESKLIDSSIVKRLRDTEECGLEKEFDKICPLLVLDPLLLYIIVNICPREVFRNFLILKIPPYISMSFLASQWKTKKVTMEEAEGTALEFTSISLILVEYKEENLQLLKATFKASEILLCNILAKLRGTPEHLTIITKAIFLYLHSAKVIDSDEMKPSLKEVQSSLEKYINQSIGKPFGSGLGVSFFEKGAEKEINIWNAMLCAYFEEDDQGVIMKSWHNVLMKIIKQRVNKVTIERRVELFVSLDKMSQCHKIILDIFITAVIEKIKHVSPAHMERLISVSDHQQHNVRKIIDKILEEHCPNHSFHITLDDLLNWDIWQTLIKIFTKEITKQKSNPNYVTFLSKTCKGACIFAQSVLNDECNGIRNGCITTKNLKTIKNQIKNFEKLLKANFIDESECEGVMRVLHQRLEEYEGFRESVDILGQLCQNIKYVKVRDLEKLVEEVNTDYSEASIKNLCRKSESKVELICLQSSKPVLEVAFQFDVLHTKFSSDLFSKLWREQLVRVQSMSEITIQDIQGRLWEPTFCNCKKLLDSLYEKTITLANVNHYMKPLENRVFQIRRLCDGVGYLTANTQNDYKWIDKAVILMKEYWSLLDLENAAKVVLDLKRKLKLTGDFTLITKLANRAYFSKENMRLCSINEEFFEAGDFLKNFKEDRGKLQCLQSFTECLDVVWWIRNETEDINSLHKFVSVALYTSAEGAYSNDKLARLKTVSSGYGPLIFDLQKDRTLENFKVCCSKVWEAFEQNPDLFRNLKYCNADLEWLKMVKGKQASVEVTSYDEMKNIVKHGRYKIGTQVVNVNTTSMSLTDVIRLSLDDKKCRTLKNYSLDELRDLESKLILVTGSMADHREQVDNFVKILSCVCRIGEVLILLREAGNVKYSEWTLEIPSNNSDDLIDDLQALAQTMEHDLESWKRVVYGARKKFYELNYYTTVQLLVLRRELSAFRDAKSETEISSEVLALLQSVSCQVSDTFPFLKDCLSETHSGDGNTSRCGCLGDVVETELANPGIRLSTTIQPQSQERFNKLETTTLDDHVSPTPTLTEEELTKEQSEIMGYIQMQLGCQQSLVLKAFLECHEKDMTRYDYLSWCNDHLEDYHTFNDNMDEAVLTESDMSDSDSELSEHNSIISPDVAVEGDWTSEDAKWSDPDNQLQDRGSREEFPALAKHDARKVHYQGALTIHSDFQAERKYLTLDNLGKALNFLSGKCPGAVVQQRVFSKYLKIGSPNLLVVSPDHVYKCILCLYMEYLSQGSSVGATPIAHPLPTPEEVLICNTSTTAEEIEVFWMRAVSDPGHLRIFVLVHADKLSYQVGDSALRSLQKHFNEKKNYRLVIICSTEGEEKSHLISKLCQYRRAFVLHDEIHIYQSYLASHFTVKPKNNVHPPASVVDFANSRVRVVSSDRSGMGKSLYIQQMAKKLQLYSQESQHCCITIPLHGPVVTADTVLKLLKELLRDEQEPNSCIYHFDIAHNVLWQVDTILFSMLILRGLCDSQGRVWRCHPNQLCAIEVTIPNSGRTLDYSQGSNLMQLLPAVSCLSPRQVVKYLSTRKPEECIDNKIRLYDKDEFSNDSYQRVCQYIQLHNRGGNLENFTYGKSPAKNIDPLDSLKLILRFCGISDPSWSEIYHFVKFLNIQLSSCEDSVYLKANLMKDFLDGMKGFIVKFMIRMSRDFSTSSLNGEVALETESKTGKIEHLKMYQIDERKRWEQSSHPYIVFNKDGETFTFVGFNVNIFGHLIDPVNNTIIERSIMTEKLWKELKSNNVNFNDDFKRWTKRVMIEKICTVIGVENSSDPDDSYVLTVDNVTKILAIQMRFRCGIPVVIMGETGCGKTRLIRYMCDLARLGLDVKNLMILKVHGGTTELDIVRFIKKAESIKKDAQKKLDDKIETAKKTFEKNLEKQISEEKKKKLKKSLEQDETKWSMAKKQLSNLDIVVFFDEANTTDAINLIKEVMCDRRLNGKPVSHDLKFIAACNPYRKHTREMIEKLENAGLGYFIKSTETQLKLGKTPLRQLVYRVLDLPPSMRPLVYDYGQLNEGAEKNYIQQIVYDHVNELSDLTGELLSSCSNLLSEILNWSQSYMRQRKDECSFVSLRDVERAMIVFQYFYNKMDLFGPLMNTYARGQQRHIDNENHDNKAFVGYKSPGKITRALILSLSVCYHARLQDRREYEVGVVSKFMAPIALPGGADQFRDEIRWCQEVLLDNMQLGDNIARNAALRENVFMMAICVELRIPLFLVGKPGSSKSLAKAIISESMRGKTSVNEFLRNFKEVDILSFSYQCSQLSTPESIADVFKNASKFQKNQDKSSYVAVVVLDEVGLAEDSPNLPLKVLHPLLEDGTEGAKKDCLDQPEIISRQERVAFIGISNWALDPAKMNRGVMVTRAEPTEEELVTSARGICSNKKQDPIRGKLEPFFEPFAKAYLRISKVQQREFFGLRDFYSLIKMLYSMCKQSGLPPTWPQLEHAIKRNFGGLESDKLNPFEEFKKEIKLNYSPPNLSGVQEELHSIMNPDCSNLGLIKTSLRRQNNWHGENRYVLFLTENYAALNILKNPNNYLSDELKQTHLKDSTDSSASEPFVLFGSSFPKDQEFTQVCRNINQIKICMETGRTVILLNLGNLYESLYDVLNQYYIYHADNRYVDLGLQSHRVKCRVHNNFRLILIAEKDTVYERFPTPLINRMEKHFVLTSSILNDWQQIVLKKLEDWINDFSDTKYSKFEKNDAFIGFQNDTSASVVFQATNLLKLALAEDICGQDSTKEEWAHAVAWSRLRCEYVDIDEEDHENSSNEDQEEWKKAVFIISQHLMLRIAAPEAIVRLEYSPLADKKSDIERAYFVNQHHKSIDDFLNHFVFSESTHESGLLMQVTTHSYLLSKDELKSIKSGNKHKITSFFLHEFHSELDFSDKVGKAFSQGSSMLSSRSLVIIQCDSELISGDLIACARYRIYDLRAKAMEESKTILDNATFAHVLFIIHLSRQEACSSLVGFQGDPWISYHIDDLKPSLDKVVSTSNALKFTVSELFMGKTMGLSELHSPILTNETMGHEMIEESENEDTESEDDFEGSVSAVNDYSAPEVCEDKTPKTFHRGMAASLLIKESCCPLYHRLHGCIQSTVSKLNDGSIRRHTKMVKILLDLIPKESPTELEKHSFYGILVDHISKLLKERDTIREDEKEWVIKEAMNPKSLQHGGTFCNVLSRKFDAIIEPLFRKIITCIDQNCNLNLINSSNQESLLSQFWLCMFRSVVKFSYEDIIIQRKEVTGVALRIAAHAFECKLPFSWLIYESMESQWDNISGDDEMEVHAQLCAALDATPIGEVLKNVDESCYNEFYHSYLHDFVRLVHECVHEDAAVEYELIVNAMYPLVELEQFYPDDKATFVQKIAALHIVFQMNKSQIMWFGQLTRHCPWILKNMIKEKDKNSKEMILHFSAVNKALDNLAEPLRTTDRSLDSYLVPWLNEVHTYQTCIISIISFPSSNNLREIARMKWEAVRVLQLFLEHVLMKHKFENSVAYFVRLKEKLKFKANFLEVSTLKGVQSHLRQTYREVSSKVEKKSVFRKHCLDYFLSIISTLCFGGTAIPEQALIESLVEILRNEDDNLISFLVSNKSNTFSGFRSSLLQILMEHSSGDVKKSLDKYFILKSSGGRKWNDTLCLECIQNFEDAMVKDLSDQSREQRMEVISDVLEESYKVLRKLKNEHNIISISYLEGVAKVRFTIMEIAQFLHSHFSHEDETEFLDKNQLSDGEHRLMKLAEKVCTDPFINSIDFRTKNSDMFGPAVYLLKLLVRLYGFPLLKKVSGRYVWVIPEGLRTANLEKAMDPFVIYDDLNLKYSLVRDSVNEEARGKRFHTLDKITKECDDRILAVLPLAIYESITLSYLSSKYAIDDKIIKEFSKYFQQPTFKISSILLHEIQVLISNNQGGSFSKMSVTPGLSSERKVLGGIVVHTVSVLAANAGYNILLPLYNMLTNPSALVDKYFPTMQEDDLVEVKRALSGRFYACPRGHPYFVGECGLPRETKLCYVCGTKIGGYYQLQKGNKEARDTDETPKGYALTSADLQGGPPGFQRNLSPQAICIIRAMMHSALLWYCCHHEDWRVVVTALMTAHGKHKNLPEFFWNHLQKDIEHLSRLTGKGIEEAALIMHMVLSEILTKPVDEVRVISQLKSKEDRKKWEDTFCAQYIYPVFKDLDDRLNRAIYLITTDEKQDHDLLFCLVYEKGRVRKTATETQLWSYRQRICLEHLWQTLQEKDLKKKYSILHEFLQAEQTLRAIKYLPDIVKLQNFLFKKFHHRLDREDAKSQTIEQYLKNNYEFTEAVESLKVAWSLVKIQAHSHLEEKHCLSAITDDVSLEYLIPTTSGAGALTTCLVDLLITAHNNFIDTCCDLAKQTYQSSWLKQKIPVMFIKQCHLLNYEDQIVPLILAHSMSSKKVGEAHKVQYDHKAIEKQLLERFIYGRPLIMSDIPLVVYRKDVVNTFTFEAVRKKVHPQQELDSQLQKDILSELRTPDRLRENLDVIDIVIGFLSSGGGRPEKPLKSYIKKVLKMDVKPFSTKAQDYCNLQHIISLWRTVSVELSRLALLHGQEPFDAVSDQFKRPLRNSGDSNQVAELEECLSFFDVDKLIGSLFEFIETHVKYSPDNELSWPIRDILIEDQFKHLGIEEVFSEKFPATVLLDQTVAVWKHLVSYQEKLKQDLK